jgi:two-component system response regulator YesN
MLKVLIADDENQIRNGILSFIDWTGLNCNIVKVSANGIDAWEYIMNNNVDLAICDIRMPGFTGLDIAKNIKDYDLKTKVILLTAYPDFNYAKTAIKYGIIDYVIKTTFIEELPTSVEKAKAKINEEKTLADNVNELSQKAKENNKLSRWKITFDILNGNMNSEYEKNLSVYAGMFENSYILFALEITESDNFIPTTDYQKALNSLVKKTFSEYDYDYFILNSNFVVLIVYISEKNCLIRYKSQKCEEVVLIAEKELNINIRIGISSISRSIGNIIKAYNESIIALSKISISSKDVNEFSIDMVPEKAENRPLDIRKYIIEIENRIEASDINGIIYEYSNFISFLINNSLGIENIKIYNVVVLSYFFKGVSNAVLKRTIIYEDFDIIIQRIYKMKSIKSIYLTTCYFLKRLGENSRISNGNDKIMVMEIESYIKKYYRDDISLENIASEMHMNSSYLSRYYKKETGEGIIESLNKYRINIAKKLLMNNDMAISKICELVGIPDPAYFTHVFRKYEMMSPKDYRNKCEHHDI